VPELFGSSKISPPCPPLSPGSNPPPSNFSSPTRETVAAAGGSSNFGRPQ